MIAKNKNSPAEWPLVSAALAVLSSSFVHHASRYGSRITLHASQFRDGVQIHVKTAPFILNHLHEARRKFYKIPCCLAGFSKLFLLTITEDTGSITGIRDSPDREFFVVL